MIKVESCALIDSIDGPSPWTTADLQRVDRVLGATTLPFGWTLRAAYDGGAVVVQVRCAEGTDNVTGEQLEWTGRKWLLSRHMTAGEIAQTVLKAALTAAEHEIRELLLFDGQPVFDPHYDIGKLVELRARPDSLKERPPHLGRS